MGPLSKRDEYDTGSDPDSPMSTFSHLVLSEEKDEYDTGGDFEILVNICAPLKSHEIQKDEYDTGSDPEISMNTYEPDLKNKKDEYDTGSDPEEVMLLNISTFTENELKWDAGTIDSSLLKNNTKKLAVNRNITRKSCG